MEGTNNKANVLLWISMQWELSQNLYFWLVCNENYHNFFVLKKYPSYQPVIVKQKSSYANYLNDFILSRRGIIILKVNRKHGVNDF